MAERWSIKGDYVETCNCDVVCQCLWLEPPDNDVCTVSFAWHIEEGHYGDVDLSGLNMALLVKTGPGVILDPSVAWHAALIVDEEADDEQRAAVEDIVLGRAGGIFAVAADTHIESTEIATAPFSYERDGTDVTVEVGDVLTMEAGGKVGFNDDVGTISPHPFNESLQFKTGKSSRAVASYNDEFSWDVSGNNSFLGDFKLANA